MTIYLKSFFVLYLLSMVSGKKRNNITCKYFKRYLILLDNKFKSSCDAEKDKCFYKCRNYPVDFQSTSRTNSSNMAESEKDIRANCLKTCESCNLKEGCLNNSEIPYIQTDIFEYSKCSKFPVEYFGNYDKNKRDRIIVIIDSGYGQSVLSSKNIFFSSISKFWISLVPYFLLPCRRGDTRFFIKSSYKLWPTI